MNNFSHLEDNCRHIERLSEKKSWSKLYEDRAAELNEERLLKTEIPPERRNLVKTIAAGAIIAKKLGKKVRQRLRNKNYSCRNTIENLKEPARARSWDAIQGTALICDICGVIVLHDSISCLTCNTSVHRLCAGHVTKMEQEMSSQSLDIMGFDSMIEEGSEDEENSDDNDSDERVMMRVRAIMTVAVTMKSILTIITKRRRKGKEDMTISCKRPCPLQPSWTIMKVLV
jgi:hypothetical protein